MRCHLARVLALGLLVAAVAACDGGQQNKDPVASFTANPTTGLRPLAVAFDASASVDPHGRIVSYAWNFGDGSGAGTGVVIAHTFQEVGAFPVTLTVTDNSGRTATAAQTIVVSGPPNQSPAAGFTMAPTRFAVPLEVYFDAAASGDADGSLVSYEWAFGDGESSKMTGKDALHRYKVAGTYTVTLKVTDDRGGTATATSTATVPLPFYRVTNLGSLGGSATTGYGINDAGDVVGYSETAGRQYHAFIHTSGAMKDLGTLQGTPDSVAYAINASGRIVGVSGSRPFLYSDGTLSNLSLLYPTDPRGWAFGINTAGQVAGVFFPGGPLDPLGRQQLGFLSSGSLFRPLPTRRANDISDNGTVVGIAANMPVAYSNGVAEEIGSPNFFEFFGFCEAMAINEVAQVVGVCGEANIGKFGGINEKTRAFVIEPGIMRDLGSLGDRLLSAAWDVNDAGQVVGTSMRRAFVYEDAAMYDLNQLLGPRDGPVLREANAINRRGQIVANGCDESGACYAFRLDPIHRPVRPAYCSSTQGGNTAPTAAFSATPVEGPSPLTVWLDATQSRDDEGSPLSYSWNFGDGTGGVGAKPYRVYGVKGQYTVTLEVRDECGASASAVRQVVVLNAPPVIDGLELGVARGMTLKARVRAHDPDEEALRSVTWDFGDGATASGTAVDVEHTYQVGGTYTVSVVVTDQGGLSATASQSIMVRPPQATFSTWVADSASPLELSFDARASSGSYAMDYRWDFGDGTTGTGTGSAVTHLYANSGVYRVVLTVFDYLGDLATLVTEVRVDRPNYALVELATLRANNLNNAGVVVGELHELGAMHAALYDNGTIKDLGTLGGYYSTAAAVNDLGQVVGSSYSSGTEFYRAFVYREGAMHDLGTLGGRESWARDVNSVGEIVGTAEAADGTRRPFLYRDGVMQDLVPLGCVGCSPEAINDAGQIAGTAYVGAPESRAFLFSVGVMQYLEVPGAKRSVATDINSSGDVVGYFQPGYGSTNSGAFLYIDGTTQDLGTMGDDDTRALAINDAGSVVGTAGIANRTAHAFLYAQGVMRDLNTLVVLSNGLRLEEAIAINERGQIVARGCYREAGVCASFRLDPQ